MESLFARSAPKRSRVCFTLGASLLLHGGLVGVAEMWTPPQPQEHSVVMSWDEYRDPGVAPLPANALVDNSEASTPPPPTVDVSTPSPVEPQTDPDFSEPVQTPVSRRPVASKPVAVTRSNHRTATQGTGSGPAVASATNGTDGVSASVTKAWFMPHPPYPQSMVGHSSSGATTVRIATDASGQVSSVIVTQSADNALLDSYTESYVRTHWRGPANASRVTQFVYRTR